MSGPFGILPDADDIERIRWQAQQARRGRFKDRTCPTCKRPDVLTAFEAARGYQCNLCTRRDEGYGMGEDP